MKKAKRKGLAGDSKSESEPEKGMGADGHDAARAQVREDERRRRELEYERAEAPLVSELCEVGCRVQSVWDLVNTNNSYAAAVKVLLSHLHRPYPVAIREGIARALAVHEASSVWSELVMSYMMERNERVKDGLAIAVLNAGGATRRDEIVAMLKDSSLGPSRIFFLLVLKLLEKEQADSLMATLAKDPDLTKEIDAMRRKAARSESRRAKRLKANRA